MSRKTIRKISISSAVLPPQAFVRSMVATVTSPRTNMKSPALRSQAERVRKINKTRRYFGVARSTSYLWRDRYRELGEEWLGSRRCGPRNHPNKTRDEVVEKILHPRRTYHMGPIRIVWYLQRYHGIRTSGATVYRVCKRHGLNRLPNRVGPRAVHTHRYEKQIPGHHVQIDVKFLRIRSGRERSRVRGEKALRAIS